jgi:hypothetical protein
LLFWAAAARNAVRCADAVFHCSPIDANETQNGSAPARACAVHRARHRHMAVGYSI